MHPNLSEVQNGENIMANNEAKAALEQFKKEAANEVGVTLNNGYNGDLTARQAGSIGGQMVKKMSPVRPLIFAFNFSSHFSVLLPVNIFNSIWSS